MKVLPVPPPAVGQPMILCKASHQINDPTANILNGICNVENEEMMDFVDDNFQLPPSFSWLISEETLHNDQYPFVLWAMLNISLPIESHF